MKTVHETELALLFCARNAFSWLGVHGTVGVEVGEGPFSIIPRGRWQGRSAAETLHSTRTAPAAPPWRHRNHATTSGPRSRYRYRDGPFVPTLLLRPHWMATS